MSIKLDKEYTQDIQDILDNNTKKRYQKNKTKPNDRIKLTIVAGLNNIAAYNYFDEKEKQSFLILEKSKEDNIDPEKIDQTTLNMFIEATGFYLDKNNLLENIKLFGLQDKFDYFIERLEKYGKSGYSRLYKVVTDYIIDIIKQNQEYKKLLENDTKLLIDNIISPPFTIFEKVYVKENNNKVYLSIDVTASIFQAYKDLGIIQEHTWTEFMSNFTKDLLIINNKKLRLRVFGKLDKDKKNSILINNTILKIWPVIKDRFEKYLVAIEGDEIVLDTINYEKELEILRSFNLPNYIRVSCYKLEYVNYIKDNKDISYYIRRFLYPENKTPDIKCARKDVLNEVYVNLYKSLHK